MGLRGETSNGEAEGFLGVVLGAVRLRGDGLVSSSDSCLTAVLRVRFVVALVALALDLTLELGSAENTSLSWSDELAAASWSEKSEAAESSSEAEDGEDGARSRFADVLTILFCTLTGVAAAEVEADGARLRNEYERRASEADNSAASAASLSAPLTTPLLLFEAAVAAVTVEVVSEVMGVGANSFRRDDDRTTKLLDMTLAATTARRAGRDWMRRIMVLERPV